MRISSIGTPEKAHTPEKSCKPGIGRHSFLLAFLLPLLLAACAAFTLVFAASPLEAKEKKALSAPAASQRRAPDNAHGALSALSETLGGLALLSQVCAPDQEPNPWRVRMESLVEAEGEASGASEQMKGAFNRGYSEYSTSYSRCTAAARAAQSALRLEAARLSREIRYKFGT